MARRRGNSNFCASKADMPKGPYPGGKVCFQRDCKQTAHFASFLRSECKSHDDSLSSWLLFFLMTH